WCAHATRGFGCVARGSPDLRRASGPASLERVSGSVPGPSSPSLLRSGVARAMASGVTHMSASSRVAPLRPLGQDAQATSEPVDAGELVEVEDDEFAVGLLELEAVEPEFVVLAVGEPRAGFLLAEALDDAVDGRGERAGLARDLLGDADGLADGICRERGGH